MDTPPPKRRKPNDEGSKVKVSKAGSDVSSDSDAIFGRGAGNSPSLSDSENDGDSLDGDVPMRWTPNQLRARIRNFLQKTDVKITEFQGMLGVNSNSYNRFVNGKYKQQWNAAENSTYEAAVRFFMKEERLGKNAIGKLRAQLSATKKSGGKTTKLPELDGIITDGLTYLTPGETRREVQKVLKEYKASIAQLARCAGVPAQSANKFMNAGGDFGAADNQVYHPLADLVEKLRIAGKKSKSKKRLALEAEVAAGRVGRDGQPFLGVSPSGTFLCMAGERPVMSRDELGRKVVRYVK